MKVFPDVFKGRLKDKAINHSFIALIPKVSNPTKIEDYIPISLVSSLYKILAEVLFKRLTIVINKVVGETQFAFLAGKQIADCALIANEVLDDIHKSKGKAFILKVDFRKAYDTVDWSFLDLRMKEIGFGAKWRKWIMLCVETTSISILVNGCLRRDLRLGADSDKEKTMGNWASKIKYRLGDFPTEYLGLPLGQAISRWSKRSLAICSSTTRDVKSGTRLGFRSGSFQVGSVSGRVHFRSGSFQVGLFQVGSEADNWQVNSGSGRLQVGFISGQQVNNRSGSKQFGFKNRSGSKQVGFSCYSNRSDSVPGQHQSVTDRVRVIAASGQTRSLPENLAYELEIESLAKILRGDTLQRRRKQPKSEIHAFEVGSYTDEIFSFVDNMAEEDETICEFAAAPNVQQPFCIGFPNGKTPFQVKT
ncbi:hypothetical protein GQ457_02G028350 [Hibiscus cannabinus]